MSFPKGISSKWNANSHVGFWTRVTDSIYNDDNRYAEHLVF